jgi:uncharacterized membrane protein YfcA
LEGYLILFSVGLISGVLNVIAGGGSSLTLPVLIFLGLETADANGTNRIGLIFQNISAILSFEQSRVNDFRSSLLYSLFTLPGAILGALASIRIGDELFQKLLSIILLFIILSMFLNPAQGRQEKSRPAKWWTYFALFGIGFYGGFIQVGVGFLIMAALYHLAGLPLVKVNVHKVFVVLVYTLPVLAVFIIKDHINWRLGLVLAAGNAIGGWSGAHLSVRGGEKTIKVILSMVIFGMAVKLFFFQ